MICACERSKDLVSNVGPFIAGGAEVGQQSKKDSSVSCVFYEPISRGYGRT